MASPRVVDMRISLIRVAADSPIVASFGRMDVRHNLLVLVDLEDGTTGVGEVWANFPPWGCGERIDILRHVVRPALIGMDPDNPARLYSSLLRRLRPLANQLGATGPFLQALAGADTALWDAHARRQGKPLADVLSGGRGRRSAAIYSTNIPIDRPDMITAMAGQGHVRFKVKLPEDQALARRGLAAARQAAGSLPLMTDASQGYDPERLEALLPALLDADLTWVEEPFPVDDTAAYQR